MKQANQTKSQYKPPNASGSKPRYQFKAIADVMGACVTL
jgi:hypothetical protein